MPDGPQKKKESKVEIAKRNSNQLRGTIPDTLHADATHFGDQDIQLLKFHGIYQQDDRDTRSPRKEQGLEPEYSFMIRIALPGGLMTADTYRGLDDLARQYTTGGLRLTTRQAIQYHGVLKGDLHATMNQINAHLATTLSACGDICRNVMASPAPLASPAHRKCQEMARDITKAMAPTTRAYHEIWIDGEKQSTTEQQPDPFYGETYLPRKFKVGVAVPEDNSIDVYSYDAGLIAIVENDDVVGWNVVAGGGLGMTTNRADTIAALAQPVAYVPVEHGVDAIRTVAAIFRDHGNRGDRKHARLKYVLQERGIEWFRDEFKQRMNCDVQPFRDIPRLGFSDYLGKQQQADGKYFYGVYAQNGRVLDRGDERIQTALRAIVEKYRCGACVTPNQNLLLLDLEEAWIDDIEQILRDHGVQTVRELTNTRRYAMACPALPTCGLALTESERVMPAVVEQFATLLEQLGLEDEQLTLRMTGCPNGCARPYTADIGFVGRKPGKQYNVYVGGGLHGDRMADLWAEDVNMDELADCVKPLLQGFAKQRQGNESFADYYQRLAGRSDRRVLITGKEEMMSERISLPVL